MNLLYWSSKLIDSKVEMLLQKQLLGKILSVATLLLEIAILILVASHFITAWREYGPAGIGDFVKDRWLLLSIAALLSVILVVLFRRMGLVGNQLQLSIPPPNEPMEVRKASLAEIQSIWEIDRNVFKRRDLVPVSVMQDWQSRNDSSFHVAIQGGQLLGYYSVLYLQRTCLSKFLEGEIKEKHFTKRELYTSNRRARPTCAYCFSVAVDPRLGLDVRRRASYLLLETLAHDLESKRVKNGLDTLLAAAATKKGRALIVGFDFVKVGRAKDRQDRHDLFKLQVSGVNLVELFRTRYARLASRAGKSSLFAF